MIFRREEKDTYGIPVSGAGDLLSPEARNSEMM